MTIHRIDTNKRLSAAVSFDNLVFLSGQVSTTLDGDFETQTKDVLEKIDSLLDKAGSSKSGLRISKKIFTHLISFGKHGCLMIVRLLVQPWKQIWLARMFWWKWR